jgi:hypothetical protein
LPLLKVEKFLKLSETTRRSIFGELAECEKDKLYTQVVASWIPVKVYYRIYYLEAVFLYMLCGSKVGFSRSGHSLVRDNFRAAIKDSKFMLANQELSKIVPWPEAENFKAQKYATTKVDYFYDPDCPYSIRGKIADYIFVNWREGEGRNFTNMNLKDAQVAKKERVVTSEINILDYFYHMRLKANYRDTDYLDFEETINENDAINYIRNYISASEKYAGGLVNSISELRRQRNMLP